MPISIVELGIVHSVRVDAPAQRVHIDITPTFIGCPALDMIRDRIQAEVRRLSPGAEVDVRFVNDPPWSVDHISETGREKLRAVGVTVPPRGARSATPSASVLTPLTISRPTLEATPACPFCGESTTRQESRFGPTRCKMIFYCDACRNSFEHMKPV